MRRIIDNAVFALDEDNFALSIDLYGDRAGILHIPERHNRKIELKPKDALSGKAPLRINTG